MEIVHAGGVAGARGARGLAVVIDVLRAFSVSAYALAGGASECLLVTDIEHARALALTIPGSVISAEIDGLPIEGIPISNSPTRIAATKLGGRVLIQRSSAGTQCTALASEVADGVLAASLVVASATVRRIRELAPPVVTFIASGTDHGHPEDSACASYMEGLLLGSRPDLDELLRPLRESERWTGIRQREVPGFPPTDLDLALQPDRFDFAMPAERLPDAVLRLRRG